MIVGLPLMKADDGTGVCGTCPERQLSVRTHPHGAPFHDIGKAVVAKRSPLVSQTILSHAQPRRGISLGESQIEEIEAGHPLPDGRSAAAARHVVDAVSGLTPDDLVLCLNSGGGSALLAAPVSGSA